MYQRNNESTLDWLFLARCCVHTGWEWNCWLSSLQDRNKGKRLLREVKRKRRMRFLNNIPEKHIHVTNRHINLHTQTNVHTNVPTLFAALLNSQLCRKVFLSRIRCMCALIVYNLCLCVTVYWRHMCCMYFLSYVEKDLLYTGGPMVSLFKQLSSSLLYIQ